MTGERKPFPVLQTRFDEIQGEFSPDGRWLAYASNESGRYEIYVQTFPVTGGKWQISVAGGLQPRWRRDGQELFYVAPDNRLMAAPIRVAPGTQGPAALMTSRIRIRVPTPKAAAPVAGCSVPLGPMRLKLSE